MKDYNEIDGIIKQTRECIENAFNKGYKQGFKDGKESCQIDETEAYQKGLSDAPTVLKSTIKR